MQKVEVSRELLIGLGATCAAAVLALVFLLGRESGRTRPLEPPPAAAVQAPEAPAQAAPVVPEPALLSPAAAPEARPKGLAPAPAATPGADPVRAAVAGYFQAIDQIQPGQMAGGPEATAKGILEGLVKGDPSGIDGMIQQSEAARAKLAALVPPAPCAGHHRESLAALDASLAILRSVRNSVQGGGSSPMPADFAVQANLLRDRSEQLQREETALRERYGLVR